MRHSPPSAQAAREVRRDTPLRQARTCYGHLAGALGVRLMDELLRQGWLEAIPEPPDCRRVYYSPTAGSAAALLERGVIMSAPKAGKPMAFSCLDWTERRWHLGGPLGRAITAALLDAGCIARVPGSRAVTLTGSLEGWMRW